MADHPRFFILEASVPARSYPGKRAPHKISEETPPIWHHAEREEDMRFAQEIQAESIEEVGDLDGVLAASSWCRQ